MKYYVCIKQVPDVNAPMQIRDHQLIRDPDRMTLNAYDASALEACLVLTEQHGGEVEVVLAGPEQAGETIRKALAMGADRGTHILLEDGGKETEYDSAVYAEILAAYFRDRTWDVIACGKQAQDSDAGLTGGMIARKLGIPFATNAVGLALVERTLTVTRQSDHGQEIIDLQAPALVTCSNDMNDPRIPNLKGIMQSKRKPVDRLTPADLGIGAESLKPSTRMTGFEEKPKRRPCRKFQGDPGEVAGQITRLLREEVAVL